MTFSGRILISGQTALPTSAFKSTNWDTDTPSLPAQTAMAWKSTDWDADSGDAESNVIGFQTTLDEWA